MSDFLSTPANLPIPPDDGAADHLVGMTMPNIALTATNGETFNVAKAAKLLVLYCYPMTGRPEVPLPEGWDQIPGARGCTPQSCSYRDHYQELKALSAEVAGLSVQNTAYQQEMVARLHLPFPVLSDAEYKLQQALNLPTFTTSGMILLKRLTMVVRHGIIEAIHYPVFPSDSDAAWIIVYLSSHSDHQRI